MLTGQRNWLLAALAIFTFISTLVILRPNTPLQPYIAAATRSGKARLGFTQDRQPLNKDLSQGTGSDGFTTLKQAIETDVYNATLGFEKIYIINLPARTDHKDDLTIAASLLDLHFDFIPGVIGKDVPDKALPPPGNQRDRFGDGNVGSWRAHMSALQTMVSQNLSSALICEDDIDFDIRLKDQMNTFAAASRALTQPLRDSPSGDYADPTLKSRDNDREVQPLEQDLNSTNTPATTTPTLSPYGDNWDVLWIGHCGALFPKPDQHIPKGRYTVLDDETVPSWHYNNSGNIYDEKVEESYLDHTRVVHHARHMICTFAYAVSQRGARRLLYDIGVSAFKDPFDVALAIWCEKKGTCLTVQPQYVTLYRAPGPENKDSDIHPDGPSKQRKKGHSPYIRLSMQMNMGKLVEGQRENLTDQYPD